MITSEVLKCSMDRDNGSNLLKMVASLPRLVFSILVNVYRYTLSPIIGPRCRYLPTCSEYALEALHKHGVLKGGWLALRRIGRCHPWKWLGGGSGYDPVPDNTEQS